MIDDADDDDDDDEMMAMAYGMIFARSCSKGAITSKIKHAIKHKASPARLAQLLQPSLAFCFSLRTMTAYRPVLDCNSCASLAGLVLCFVAAACCSCNNQ